MKKILFILMLAIFLIPSAQALVGVCWDFYDGDSVCLNGTGVYNGITGTSLMVNTSGSYNATIIQTLTNHNSSIELRPLYSLIYGNLSLYASKQYELYNNISSAMGAGYNATLVSYAGQALKHYSNITALQGENTTVWNNLYELNTNDTLMDNKFNLSIENLAQEVNYNDTYNFNWFNTSIEFRPQYSLIYANLSMYSSVKDELYNNMTATNLSIENLATEINANDTFITNHFNTSVELRANKTSPFFTGTVTSAGAINQTLTHGSGSSYVTMLDFGNVSIVTNGTHICLKGKGYLCVES